MNNDPIVILLAEDDEGHAKLVEKNLRRAGFVNDVVHVPNGRQALDYVHRRGLFASRNPNGPLLLVLDINMPLIDGVEVLRQVKADPSTDKLPVIMLTTTDDPREVSRCYELGCSVYITKPVAYESFVEAVRRLGLFLQVVTVLREDELRKE
jgi:CheY-like chemotaxis protein